MSPGHAIDVDVAAGAAAEELAALDEGTTPALDEVRVAELRVEATGLDEAAEPDDAAEPVEAAAPEEDAALEDAPAPEDAAGLDETPELDEAPGIDDAAGLEVAAGLDDAAGLEEAPETVMPVLETAEAAPEAVGLAPVRSLAPHTSRFVLGAPRPLFR